MIEPRVSSGPRRDDPAEAGRSDRQPYGRARARKVSLRLRLAAFAALAMTLVIAERTVSLFRIHADNLATAERHVMEMLDHSVGRYEATLSTVRAVLLTLASDRDSVPGGLPPAAEGTAAAPDTRDPSQTLDYVEACRPLARVQKAFPAIESLAIVDANGIVRCGTAPGAAGLDISRRNHVRIALRGISNVDPVLRSRLTDRPALYAAQPIVDPNGGGIIGVIAARIGLNELFPHGALAELGAGTEVILVSPVGTVMLAYPEGILGLGLDVANVAPVARALSHTRGTLLAEGPDGVQRIYAYTRIAGTNMHLLVGVDQTVVMAPAERATWSAGITLLAVGLIILIGLWVAGERLVVAPVQALADRLIRFGHGDIEPPKSTVLVTELQPLASAFEAMALELTRRETALRTANRRLNSLASLDPLTGIANRRSFDAILALQWNSVPQLAMLILDIDNFKSFNDTYGHKEGDRCIRAVAQTLASTLRGTDMVARVGGEEFAVLMPNAEIGIAIDVAERLRRAVERLDIPHAKGVASKVTISVGCAACRPTLELSPNNLYVAADQALYAAKHTGRNAVRAAADDIVPDPAKAAEALRPGRSGGTAG